MKFVCAWCKSELDSTNSSSNNIDKLSHGICEQCSEKFKYQMGVELNEYIEDLPVPILLVTEERIVLAANKIARKVIDKESYQISQQRAGEVFECINAKSQEGCGLTVHCSGCVIRQSVIETYKTGEGISNKPAILHQYRDGKIDMYISTEKVGDTVLLRVDKILDLVAAK